MDTLHVNLFTAGDSADIKTWSNLPYFFSRSLIDNGVKVHRINIFPENDWRSRLYSRIRWRYDRARKALSGKDSAFDFCRDRVMHHLANDKIKEELKRAPHADFNIFLTFSFSSWRYSATPVVHLCDCTYEQRLEDLGKPKNRKDRHFIEIEKLLLRKAFMVFGTGSKCCGFLKTRYRLPNVHTFLGGINLEPENVDDEGALLNGKWNSKRILFVGRGIRKRGVDILVRAFRMFDERNPGQFGLDIVGVCREALGDPGSNVRCFAYLDKGNPRDSETYLGLLRSATVFVMPMREGPFPAAVKEAASMFVPVIMSDVWNDGGAVIHDYNGILVSEIEAGEFARQMHSLLNDRARWERLARNAHESARKYSWEAETLKLIEAITQRSL